MTGSPRVVIGAPLYNHADHLREALEGLLSQTYGDFALVLLDDASTDRTPEIAQEYAALDARIVYRRNPSRLGMVRNWRLTFEVARDLHPAAEYFAWASDHDMWHPRWLGVLVSELDRHPEVVLAYPLNMRVTEGGETIAIAPWRFETFGVSGVVTRFGRTCMRMSAGNMVYGLFRPQALARAGVFRAVLVPDRLLLAELSLQGQFRQVPEVLWFRRSYGPLFGLERQRRALFAGRPPAYASLPWWAVHTAVLAWTLGLRRAGRPPIGRLRGLALAVAYGPLVVCLRLRQRLGEWLRQLRKGAVAVYGGVRARMTGMRQSAGLGAEARPAPRQTGPRAGGVTAARRD